MTYSLDPYRDWETSWESENPEPYPIPCHENKKLQPMWTNIEMICRVQWHKRRWEAFKVAFPNWRLSIWGIENR